MFYFFAGSLIAICIYLLVAAIKLKRFLPAICALAYVLSYVFCVWIYFKIPLKSLYVIRALFFLCPLAWTFYFKYEFQKSLAKDATSDDEILNNTNGDEISASKARTES